MKTSIHKWGNSLAIRIPKAFAAHLGMTSGEEVELSLKKDGLYIEPSRQTLDEMLATITPDMLHAEMEWGTPVGKESW